MIEIKFTCDKCGAEETIDEEDDIDEKRMVPVCNKCYKKFEKRRLDYVKRIKKFYEEFHIDVDTFKIE